MFCLNCFKEGWSRRDKIVIFKQNGSTEIYDEPALRKCIAGFLSDDSRARYDKLGLQFYQRDLNHLLEGLSLFYKSIDTEAKNPQANNDDSRA